MAWAQHHHGLSVTFRLASPAHSWTRTLQVIVTHRRHREEDRWEWHRYDLFVREIGYCCPRAPGSIPIFLERVFRGVVVSLAFLPYWLGRIGRYLLVQSI